MAAHDDAHAATDTAPAPPTDQEAPEAAAGGAVDAPLPEADPAPALASAPSADAAVAEPELPPDGAQDPEERSEPSTDQAAAVEEPAADKGLSPAQTAQRLAELFPALFGPQPKPIKLKIQADLQQRAPGVFQRRSLSWFLSRHTTTNAYLKALLQHSTRFDLDGQPSGEISAEHRQAAEEELARRRAIAQAKRQAARGPQGPGRDRPTRHGPPAGERVPPNDTANDTGTPPNAGTPEQASGQPGDGADPSRARRAAPLPGRGQPTGERRERGPRRENRGASAQAAGPPSARGPGPSSVGQPTPEQRQPRRPDHRPQHAQVRHGPPPHRQDNGRPRAPNAANAAHATQAPQHDHTARPPAVQPPATPQDPAQRDRWQLLRAWESTSLSKSNFCALKRLTEADFDAQIALARQERGAARGG
jgi:ProP effector